MSSINDPANQANNGNLNKEDIEHLAKYNSINDFRNNVDKGIMYDEIRQSMLNLYHGTKDEEWFLEELIKNFDKLLSYESGVQFISDINSRINEDFQSWTDSIFSHYSEILKYKSGFRLLRDTIRKKKDSKQATLLIEDVFSSFDELKTNENYFKLFTEILKIYSGDEAVKEILNSFDWATDPNSFDYLQCFSRFFSVADIQFFTSYIEEPLKFTSSEYDCNILYLILASADEELAEQMINKLIPSLPRFLDQDYLIQIVLIIIERATPEQHISIYAIFNFVLQQKKQYSNNFELVILKFFESMSRKQRLIFFNSHFSFFQDSCSKEISNLLKTMLRNDKNYQK